MSIQLTLKADNATETRVLEYLQANASDVLAEKINAGTKTLAGCIDYAKEQARKIANGASSICVDDATVFGWIIHFFEEDDIKEGEKPKAKVRTLAPQPVKKPEPKPVKPAKVRTVATAPEQPPKPNPIPRKPAKGAVSEGQLSLIEELFK